MFEWTLNGKNRTRMVKRRKKMKKAQCRKKHLKFVHLKQKSNCKNGAETKNQKMA